ncbi:MAG: HDIG domain-containing protein [Firmicutes bacterium]|nr:HDIG domain-containing protein [Bacillota bacterium]
MILVVWAILSWNLAPEKINVRVGEALPYDVRAPRTAVDSYATQQARTQARQSTQEIYTLNPQVTEEAMRRLDGSFEAAAQLRNPSPTVGVTDQEAQALISESPLTITMSDAKNLLAASPQELTLMQRIAETVLHTVMDPGVRPDALTQARDQISALLQNYNLSQAQRITVSDLCQQALTANLFPDEQATAEAQQRAEAAVQPVLIEQGQVIGHRGERVDAHLYQQLRDLGLLSEQPTFAWYTGLLLAVAASFTLYLPLAVRLHLKVWQDNQLLALFSLLALLGAILVKLVALAQPLNIGPVGYIAPVACVSMMATMLLSPESGLFLAVWVGVINGIAYRFDMGAALVGFFTAAAGAAAVIRVEHRVTLTIAGGVVAGTAITLIAALDLMLGVREATGIWQVVSRTVLFGVGNGVLSAVLTVGLLPFLESAFGVLTPIRLLELANPAQPLLRRLMIEAPGTYHHSILVGNLAEAAAEVVGANPLLARVAAYYHDIGKLKRPLFFVENQFWRDNPHDRLNPSLSYLIISSHTTDGAQLGKEYRLPPLIREMIIEHHGTTVVRYFYHKAVEAQPTSPPSEDEYRYRGVKPQSKEAAILMLADATEASVRSLEHPTPSRMEQMVWRIIRDRLQDGQLDECDLTLRNLDDIAQAFLRVLAGIFHHRVAYPGQPGASQTKHKPDRKEEQQIHESATRRDDSKTAPG